MTTLAETLYDAGVTSVADDGTVIHPIRLPSPAQELLRSYFDFWVRLAPWRSSSLLDAQRQASELQSWTDWSDRTLAQVLGTTHPTVRALLQGRGATTSRTATVRARLREVHELVARIHALTGSSAAVTARALSELPPGSDRRPLDYLRAGDVRHAYLAALDIVRPAPRDTNGLLSADWPVRAGEASVELIDEE
jgi:hypothetical protein